MELTRLRLERPPQPLEPRGDAFPVTNVEYDKKLREKENEELRAHRYVYWTPRQLEMIFIHVYFIHTTSSFSRYKVSFFFFLPFKC
jgi:hypothetical protein